MKKILIAGAKFSDIPSIRAAKRLGFYVITSGNNKNDLGHLHADKTILCDYSDVAAMTKIAKKENISALFPSCDDVSYLTCAEMCESLDIGTFDSVNTTKIIHHKDLWRDFLIKNDLPSPKAVSFDNIESALDSIPKIFLDSKVIIKPIDFATGKGISTAFIRRDIDLKPFVIEAMSNSKSKRIVVEEFLEGSNHGFSVLLKKQKVIFYFYDNEMHDFNPFAVSGTITSNIFTHDIIKSLILQIETIAKLLSLKDGIFHTQVILKNEDGIKKPYIVETCRRAGGDLYAEFVAKSCKIDYMRLAISLQNNISIESIFKNESTPVAQIMQSECDQIGEKIAPLINTQLQSFKITNDGEYPLFSNDRYIARVCLMSHKTGFYKGVKYPKYLKECLVDSIIWAKDGECIEDTRKYKAGIAFFEFKNKEEAEKSLTDYQYLLELK